MPRSSPASRTCIPVRRAASDERPPPRYTGMVPTPSMNALVEIPLTPLPVKYSALPRNTTFRFNTSGKKIESENDRWFDASRSEEHTSELQSRQYIVCRLL